MRAREFVTETEQLNEWVAVAARGLFSAGAQIFKILTYYWLVTDFADVVKIIYKMFSKGPEQLDMDEWFSLGIYILMLKFQWAGIKADIKYAKELAAKVKEMNPEMAKKISDTTKQGFEQAKAKSGASADSKGVSITQKPAGQKPARSPEEIADMKAKGYDPETGMKIQPTAPGDLKTQAQAAAQRFKESVK
jgi:hypothetical protein